MTTELKHCKACGLNKATSEFSPFRNDGKPRLVSVCRECNADRRRRYLATPAGQESMKRTAERTDPAQRRAKSLLGSAVRYGKVYRWPVCAMPECDSPNPQGHHADYSRPLDVVWLCRVHHKQAHSLSRQLSAIAAQADGGGK